MRRDRRDFFVRSRGGRKGIQVAAQFGRVLSQRLFRLFQYRFFIDQFVTFHIFWQAHIAQFIRLDAFHKAALIVVDAIDNFFGNFGFGHAMIRGHVLRFAFRDVLSKANVAFVIVGAGTTTKQDVRQAQFRHILVRRLIHPSVDDSDASEIRSGRILIIFAKILLLGIAAHEEARVETKEVTSLGRLLLLAAQLGKGINESNAVTSLQVPRRLERVLGRRSGCFLLGTNEMSNVQDGKTSKIPELSIEQPFGLARQTYIAYNSQQRFNGRECDMSTTQ